MSSKQNKNFEIVQYNFEVFCFCNDNLLYFILFLFFLYFQSIFKKLSARCVLHFAGDCGNNISNRLYCFALNSLTRFLSVVEQIQHFSFSAGP